MVAYRVIFLGSLCYLLSAHVSYAQTQLQKGIYLRPGAAQLDSTLQSVRRQTGMVFSYNAKKLNARQKVLIPPNLRTLSDFLDLLQKEKKFTVKVIENYVVIGLPNEKSKPVDQSPNNPSPKTVNTSVPAKSNDSIPPQNEIPDSPIEISPKPDSAKIDFLLASSDSLSTLAENAKSKPKESIPIATTLRDSITYKTSATAQSQSNLPDSAKVTSTIDSTKTKPKRPRQNPFIKPGISVDEASFMGLMVQGGWPLAYISVSGHSNLLASHVRYGLGSSLKLGSRFWLHLTANYGPVNRNGHFIDSIGNRHSISVKSTWMRFGAGVGFQFKDKINVQLIPLFNRLSTQYFIDGSASDLHIFRNEGDDLFYAIRAPYSLSNNFSPNTQSNTRFWIGFQLNLLYTINFPKRDKGMP